MSKRILLVEDHFIMRQALAGLFRQHDHNVDVLEASDGHAAIALVASVSPDVVIMDVSMPELNGIDATRQIIASHPKIRVVALSAYSDRKRIVQMLEAGAHAYVLKDAPFEELTEAIAAVLAGRIYLSRKAARALNGAVVKGQSGEVTFTRLPATDPLTPRERQVLLLIAEGKGAREAAALLKISVKTVETHRGSIMSKLGVSGAAELTRYALREGLTTLKS